VPRNIALLDTNVLVAFADNRDQHHEQALLFLESEDRFRWLVTRPVVVEACGVLMSRRDRRIVLGLLTWMLSPGSNVVLLPAPHPPLDVEAVLWEHSRWMQRFGIDYVDAYLMEIAHRLTTVCELRPHAPIVTFDTGDYFKCSRQGYAFSLYDMRDLQLIEFD